MVSLSARGYWMVEITDADHARMPVVKKFAIHSRDIGCTQAVVVYHEGGTMRAGMFRTHTSHWYRSLEIAEKVLLDAVASFENRGYSYSFAEWWPAMEAAMAKNNCSPWDGTDPDDSDFELPNYL